MKIAQVDLENSIQLTNELEKNCNQQTIECNALENENKIMKSDIGELIKTIESLLEERVQVEGKLEELRNENQRLDLILRQL